MHALYEASLNHHDKVKACQPVRGGLGGLNLISVVTLHVRVVLAAEYSRVLFRNVRRCCRPDSIVGADAREQLYAYYVELL